LLTTPVGAKLESQLNLACSGRQRSLASGAENGYHSGGGSVFLSPNISKKLSSVKEACFASASPFPE